MARHILVFRENLVFFLTFRRYCTLISFLMHDPNHFIENEKKNVGIPKLTSQDSISGSSICCRVTQKAEVRRDRRLDIPGFPRETSLNRLFHRYTRQSRAVGVLRCDRQLLSYRPISNTYTHFSCLTLSAELTAVEPSSLSLFA